MKLVFKSLARLSYTSFTFLSVYFFGLLRFVSWSSVYKVRTFQTLWRVETHKKKFEGVRVSLEFKKVRNFLCKGITDVVSDKIKKQWYYFEGDFSGEINPYPDCYGWIMFRPNVREYSRQSWILDSTPWIQILGTEFQSLSV